MIICSLKDRAYEKENSDVLSTAREGDQASNILREELEYLIAKQNFSVGETEKAISSLEDRNEMKTFLVGNNLAELNYKLELLLVLTIKTLCFQH